MVSKRPPLEEMTLRQLRRVASLHGIFRYSRMRKSQLLVAIQSAEQRATSPSMPRRLEAQEEVEAAKFNLGPNTAGSAGLLTEELNSVDENLPSLPEGYGESRIILMPRDPLWAYVYWDVPNDHRERLRRQGGQDLMLRIYDVTNLDFDQEVPHSIQEYVCDELAREWYLPITLSDRDYLVEIGYACRDGRWLVLARSTAVRVPPVYPSEWAEEHFVEVQWQEDLTDRNVYVLNPPATALGQGLERSSRRSHSLNGHTTGSGHLQPVSSHTNGFSYSQNLALVVSTPAAPTGELGQAQQRPAAVAPPPVSAPAPVAASAAPSPGLPVSAAAFADAVLTDAVLTDAVLMNGDLLLPTVGETVDRQASIPPASIPSEQAPMDAGIAVHPDDRDPSLSSGAARRSTPWTLPWALSSSSALPRWSLMPRSFMLQGASGVAVLPPLAPVRKGYLEVWDRSGAGSQWSWSLLKNTGAVLWQWATQKLF
ncbi:MAG: DUF4912 domain-containing protein [Prochlorothrix sp.]